MSSDRGPSPCDTGPLELRLEVIVPGTLAGRCVATRSTELMQRVGEQNVRSDGVVVPLETRAMEDRPTTALPAGIGSLPSAAVPDPTPLAERVAFVTGAARASAERSPWPSPTPAPTSPWPTCTLRRSKASSGTAYAGGCRGPRRRCRRRARWPPSGASTSITVDVCDATAATDAIARCTDQLGPPDVVVNNAGIVNNIAPIAGMSPDAWAHELQVNLSGMFHVVRAAAPGMAERGWGRVINALRSRFARLGQPAYAASKAGVIGFTKAVAQEFGPGGVTANAILPGLIATPLVRSMPRHQGEDVGAPGSGASVSRRTSPPFRRSSPHRPPASSAAWRSPATAE